MAGVDGCRGGWIVATPEGDFWLASTWAEVVAVPCRLALVDMPIGLPCRPREPRACDREARRVVGPRRSSVFPAPSRCALPLTDYAEARPLGLSAQTFHLLPKIREVDAWMTPERQRSVREGHPEVAFAWLAGMPMTHAKRTREGQAERLALLPGLSETALREFVRAHRGLVAFDDVLDALALARLAAWHDEGGGRSLGDGATDERGLRMEIAGF